MRTNFSAPTAYAPYRSITLSIRSCSISTGRSIKSSTFQPSRIPGMFGGNSNWRGPIWMPVNGLIIRGLLSDVSVLWPGLQGGMPHRLGKLHDAVRSREGNRPPQRKHLSAWRGRQASGLWRDEEVSGGSALEGLHPVTTSTSMATTAPGSAPATRQAGPD